MNSLDEKERVQKLIHELLDNTNLIHAGLNKLVYLILKESPVDNLKTNLKNFIKKCLEDEINDIDIAEGVLVIIDFCTKGEDFGKELFFDVIETILSNLDDRSYPYCILSIAIEQSKSLLDNKDLYHISEMLKSNFSFFHIRDMESVRILTCSINRINIEIRDSDNKLLPYKLSISLILMLKGLYRCIFLDTDNILEPQSKIWLFMYSTEVEKLIGQEVSFTTDYQSIHMEKADYECPDIILINPDYEKNNNLLDSSINISSIYFFTSTIMNIKNHLCHFDIQNDKEQRHIILNAIANVYGFAMPELNASHKVNINTAKLREYLSNKPS